MVGRWVVAAGVLLAAATTASADEGPDLAAALDQAKREHKPVVLELTADWCKPCKRFESEVLPDERVQQAVRDVVFVACDVETERGKAIQERYDGTAVPTFLVLDADGAELDRKTGFVDVDAFVALIDRAKRIATPEPVDVAEDAAALSSAADWYQVRGRSAEALDKLERAAAADPDDAAGVGAAAAWRAGELRAAIAGRKEAVARAVEQVESFPGAAGSTSAVARAVLSGDLTPERARELLRAHLGALEAEAANLERFHYLLYVALAADEKSLAVFAANKLLPLADHPKYHFAIAEAHHLAGDDETARERLTACGSHPSCKALAERIESGDTTSRGTVYVQRHVDAYFHNLEKPDHDGDEQRERIRRDIADASRSDGAQQEYERFTKFFKAAHDSFERAGRNCAEHRGGLREAWVRLALQPGDPPARVTVLEPSADDALIRCLRDALRERALPDPPRHLHNEYVGVVRFDAAARESVRAAPVDGDRDRLHRDWLLVLRHGHGMYEDSSLQARVFLPLLNDDDGLRPSLMLDGELGRAGGTAYNANVMFGAAVSSHPARVGLFIGAGASRTGDTVPFAWQLPLELSISIDSPNVRMHAWARMVWTTGSEREGGSFTAQQTADELLLGAGYTLPASTRRGLFFGLYYREVMGDKIGGIMLGTNNARY